MYKGAKRGSRLCQGGSKGSLMLARTPKFFPPMGWGLHSSLGVVLTNLATSPPTGSFPVETCQPRIGDQRRIDQGKHFPCPECLSLSFQHRTLCSWEPEAELALPPNRCMTSPRLTPTGHLRLLVGLLPTPCLLADLSWGGNLGFTPPHAG